MVAAGDGRPRSLAGEGMAGGGSWATRSGGGGAGHLRRELLSLSLNSFDLALVCSLSLCPLFSLSLAPDSRPDFFPTMVPARRLCFPRELARASKIVEGDAYLD
jgi:hypothetical protein